MHTPARGLPRAVRAPHTREPSPATRDVVPRPRVGRPERGRVGGRPHGPRERGRALERLHGSDLARERRRGRRRGGDRRLERRERRREGRLERWEIEREKRRVGRAKWQPRRRRGGSRGWHFERHPGLARGFGVASETRAFGRQRRRTVGERGRCGCVVDIGRYFVTCERVWDERGDENATIHRRWVEDLGSVTRVSSMRHRWDV